MVRLYSVQVRCDIISFGTIFIRSVQETSKSYGMHVVSAVQHVHACTRSPELCV